MGVSMFLARSNLMTRRNGIIRIIADRQVTDDHIAFFEHLWTNGISLDKASLQTNYICHASCQINQ
ncbi:Uncharacterised protein [Mycobacterium tuberculosis]|nr:Uncharacterised protein [Mycobacterium tuberculosis]